MESLLTPLRAEDVPRLISDARKIASGLSMAAPTIDHLRALLVGGEAQLGQAMQRSSAIVAALMVQSHTQIHKVNVDLATGHDIEVERDGSVVTLRLKKLPALSRAVN